MKRVPSGIDNLDEVMGGGFPEKLNILIIGDTGVGKTVLCTQFLVNGAVKFNERGIFILVDEKPQDLRSDMLSLGFDIHTLEKRKMIQIINAKKFCLGTDSICDFRYDSNSFIEEIVKTAHDLSAQRLVLDSVDGFLGIFGNFLDFKMFIVQLCDILKDLEVISLLTTRFTSVENIFSSYKDMELLCQGIIHLWFEEKGHDLKSLLRIRKMPGNYHFLSKRPFIIQKGGLLVF